MTEREAFLIAWNNSGGLVNASYASKFLNYSITWIADLHKKGKIRSFSFTGMKKLYYWNDLKKICEEEGINIKAVAQPCNRQ